MQPEEIIAKVFGISVAEVNDESSNKTISAWDSYGHLTLVLELEATYGVSLSAEEVFNMTTVSTIKKTLNGHGVNWRQV